MSDPSSPSLPQVGATISGKYILEELIGKGGMGAVYIARHIKLNSKFAIKVMFADAGSHESAQRFLHEGRAAAAIQNDHVVRVFDVDEEHGYAYMVLELLKGEDLSKVLWREKRIPYKVAVEYVIQALDGVLQAHAIGIVHRDLKPANLFLAQQQNGSRVVKVLDFGISKANNKSPLGDSPSALTSTKAMLGSPLYMSPEQLRSSKSVDARADIWAFGIILFELIVGKLPFFGENLGELFAAILETEPEPIRTRVPEVPPVLEAIILRCLEKKQENRFQSAADLGQALLPFTGGSGASPYAFNTVLTPPMSVMGGPMSGPAVGAISAPLGVVSEVSNPGQAWTPGANDGRVPVVRGTVPLGAITPHPQQQLLQQQQLQQQLAQPQRQTGNAWQNTGGGTKSTNKGMIAGLLVLAFIGLAGIAVFGVSSMKERARVAAAAASASAAAAAAGSSSAAPTSQVASNSATAMPSAAESGAAATTTASASAPVVASSGAIAVVTPPPVIPGVVTTRRPPIGGPVVKPDPPKPDPPKPDPPKPPTRPTATAPTSTGTGTGTSVQQNTR